MFVIPAIDLLGGKCVRLRQGDYDHSTAFEGSPVETAAAFFREGARWLHVVDLDGAKAGEPVHLEVVREICSALPDLCVELGGGIRSLGSAYAALEAGVARVVIGTSLVRDVGLAATLFRDLGPRVVSGIDTKDGVVAVHGWTETTALDGMEFAKRLEAIGCPRVIFTDIATDGMMKGPNLAATERIASTLGIPVISSGGVSSVQDLARLSRIQNVEAAIVGRALYDGAFTLAEGIRAAR